MSTEGPLRASACNYGYVDPLSYWWWKGFRTLSCRYLLPVGARFRLRRYGLLASIQNWWSGKVLICRARKHTVSVQTRFGCTFRYLRHITVKYPQKARSLVPRRSERNRHKPRESAGGDPTTPGRSSFRTIDIAFSLLDI
jgi:hypothetical protein